jgi:hypothetical protein
MRPNPTALFVMFLFLASALGVGWSVRTAKIADRDRIALVADMDSIRDDLKSAKEEIERQSAAIKALDNNGIKPGHEKVVSLSAFNAHLTEFELHVMSFNDLKKRVSRIDGNR